MGVENWSNLLPELIEIISRKLTNYADYVRFRAVCVNWYSNLSPTPPYFQFPRLMLPFEPHNENRCSFFSLLENKIIHELNIPNTYQAAQAHCCGSSQGWLLLIEERSPNLFLFNPLTGSQIHLPPLTAFPDVLDFNILNVGKEYSLIGDNDLYKCGLDVINDIYIQRFSLSSKNPSEDYVIVAIAGFQEKLVFCKKGYEKWTILEDAGLHYGSYRFQDVIYYEGLFYAVTRSRYVEICDFSSSSPLVKIIETTSSTYSEDDESYTIIMYLVADSFGELLSVDRFVYDQSEYEYDDEDDHFYQTDNFRVFRLDSSRSKWEQVKSLDDCMLFLGTNSSLCLSANDFPAAACQGNCIYFTRAGMYSPATCEHDMGVFNVGNNSMEALPCCSTGSDQILLPPLLWLTHN